MVVSYGNILRNLFCSSMDLTDWSSLWASWTRILCGVRVYRDDSMYLSWSVISFIARWTLLYIRAHRQESACFDSSSALLHAQRRAGTPWSCRRSLMMRQVAASCLGASQSQREIASATVGFHWGDLSTASENPTPCITSSEERLGEHNLWSLFVHPWGTGAWDEKDWWAKCTVVWMWNLGSRERERRTELRVLKFGYGEERRK